MKTWNWVTTLWLAALTVWGLSSCTARVEKTGTPKMDATQALQTVQALVSQGEQTQFSAPITPAPSATATSTPAEVTPVRPEPSLTPRPTASPLPPSSTPACDRAAAGNPIDVTIPDDTTFLPGESFTKIWRLVNAGSCTWTRQYAARFFYGSIMDAPDTVNLPQAVSPGQSVEIAVDMVAPATPGVQQGNWKLQNSEGQLFGIGPNGNAPFWVRIVVLSPPTVAPSLTPTATPSLTQAPSPTITASPTETASPTATQPVQANGSVTLQVGQALDLDTGEVNKGEDDDLAYQVDGSGFHVLTPQPGTVVGVLGLSEPVLANCQTASMSAAPLALESISPGTYLCFQTDEALYGWLHYISLNTSDQSASLDFRTWQTH